MQSIIASQTVARRRPASPASLPAPRREAGASFFESLGARNETVHYRSDFRPSRRPAPLSRPPRSSILGQKPAPRPRGKEPRGPGLLSRLGRSLIAALRAVGRGLGFILRGAGKAIGKAFAHVAAGLLAALRALGRLPSLAASALFGSAPRASSAATQAAHAASAARATHTARAANAASHAATSPAPEPFLGPAIQRAFAGTRFSLPLALPPPPLFRARTETEKPGFEAKSPRREPRGTRKPFAFRSSLSRLPSRLSPAHPRRAIATGAILALCLTAAAVLALLPPSFPLPQGELLPQAQTVDDPAADLLLSYLSPDLVEDADKAAPGGLPLPRLFSTSTYTVAPGDSLSAIAKKTGRRADSIISLNGLRNVGAVKKGMVLQIPNMDGVVHIVRKGESLAKVASTYKVDLTLLADTNDLGSAGLKVGQRLFIPGARLPETTMRQVYGTTVAWPVRGPISSPFGIRSDPFTGVRRFHAGIDIVVNLGTPVKAAMDGRIVDLGYNANYGNYVIEANSEGIQILYGHLSAFCVTQGQSVGQGTVIAKSGNTGYSTGPHLHLGIYQRGVAVDPRKYLK